MRGLDPRIWNDDKGSGRGNILIRHPDESLRSSLGGCKLESGFRRNDDEGIW